MFYTGEYITQMFFAYRGGAQGDKPSCATNTCILDKRFNRSLYLFNGPPNCGNSKMAMLRLEELKCLDVASDTEIKSE
jgi:hypothetical protein